MKEYPRRARIRRRMGISYTATQTSKMNRFPNDGLVDDDGECHIRRDVSDKILARPPAIRHIIHVEM